MKRTTIKAVKLENLVSEVKAVCEKKQKRREAVLRLKPLDTAPDIKAAMRSLLQHQHRIAFVGIGNELKGDDGAGPLFVKTLEEHIWMLPPVEKEKLIERVGYINSGTAPENITGFLKRFSPSLVAFVDAADIGMEPGSIGLFAPEELGNSPLSTHTLPLKIIVEYLKEEMDAEFVILGIQPYSTEPMIEISPFVKDSVGVVCEVIMEVLREDA